MSTDSLADTAEMPRPDAVGGRSPTAAVRVDFAALTHPGKVRPNNEDNFHAGRFGRYLQTLRSSLPEGQVPRSAEEAGYVFVVADGMGGQAAGEVASRLAITFLVESALKTPDWIFGRKEPYTSEVLDRAVQRFSEVNEALLDRAADRPALRGMGSTLSVALTLGDDLIVAHVGDSPVFLSSRDGFFRLTRDHTVGEELARRGLADPGHFRHVLTNAMGIRDTGGKPDVRRLRLADGDRLLLCTDGLTNMVDDATIQRELRRGAPAEQTCRTLLDLALENGGRDNVTVIVADYSIPKG